jgi:beta-mannosidase
MTLLKETTSHNVLHITQCIKSAWQFKKATDTVWYKATVPGTVHTDLLANKLIEDPFYRDNERKLQWIAQEDWAYTTQFNVDEKVLLKQHIHLVFNGLDTYATVYLNNVKLLEADNMFRTWTVDVKHILKAKKNNLHIYFHSPVKRIEKLAKAILPLATPAVFEPKAGHIRKAQYAFGWDWGPRFATSGIFRNIEIDAWDDVTVNNYQFIWNNISNAKAVGVLNLNISSTVTATHNIVLKAIPFANGKKGTAFNYTNTIKVTPGNHTISFNIVIHKPSIWFTNELGLAHVYKGSIVITTGKTIIDEKKIQFGVRTVTLVQEKDQVGKSFYIKLNGKPVFMKGANWIPSDNFLPRVSYHDYEQWILHAKATHCNMLRVWGGGFYEEDAFYDLCNEHGILVWQDFMFACGMPAGDEAYVKTATQEFIDNIIRLRNHPCIAFWCGNNEIDEAWKGWGWQEKFNLNKKQAAIVESWYNTIFHKILPKVTAKYDGTRYYYPSSPLYTWSNPKSETEGDQHYWGTFHMMQPYEAHHDKTGRFSSEWGMQAMPTWNVVKTYLKPEDYHIPSAAMQTHQKHPSGYVNLQHYIDMYFANPCNFKDYVYITQALQHYCLKTAFNAHFRKMPYCMGSLVWQINDCWPVASWAMMDYKRNWKGGMYAAKTAFKAISVIGEYYNNKVYLSAINHNGIDLKNAMIVTKIYNGNGQLLKEKNYKTKSLKKGYHHEIINSSTFYKNIPDIAQTYTTVQLIEDGTVKKHKVLATTIIYGSKPNTFTLAKPTIEIVQKNETTIVLSTNTIARYVELSHNNAEIHCSDNYFDLLPGNKKIITVTTTSKNKNILQQLKVKSLYDVK